MKINFVTQWFPPEPGGLVAWGMADGLASRGHDVHVLTGFPNYPTGRLPEGWRVRPYQRDLEPNGLTVHRAPLYPSHDSSSLRRMVNYVSFAVGATGVGLCRLRVPDVWLTYSSPALAALPAMTAQIRGRAPHCLVIQDLWPDSVLQSGLIRGGAARVAQYGLGSFCKVAYRQASRIGVISPGMRTVLVDRGVAVEKIDYTPNWLAPHLVPPADQPSTTRAQLGLPDGPLFLYAGNLGGLQGLSDLVVAFFKVRGAHLVLMGTGVERDRLKALAAQAPDKNVTVLEAVPARDVARFVAAADVQVVSLMDSPLLRVTMPSKMQSSLAAGKPILVHGCGDVARVVQEAHAGEAVAPGDPDRTAAAIRTLAELPAADRARMGLRARQYYDHNFSQSAGSARLESMLMRAERGRQ